MYERMKFIGQDQDLETEGVYDVEVMELDDQSRIVMLKEPEGKVFRYKDVAEMDGNWIPGEPVLEHVHGDGQPHSHAESNAVFTFHMSTGESVKCVSSMDGEGKPLQIVETEKDYMGNAVDGGVAVIFKSQLAWIEIRPA